MSQVLHGLAAMRMIKYLYAKLLYLFGLASNNPKLAEAVWSQVQATVQYSAVQFSTASTEQYSTGGVVAGVGVRAD